MGIAPIGKCFSLKTFSGALSLVLLLFVEQGYSAKPISIRVSSDLDFGVGVAGDSAKTVSSGYSDDAQNASFDISGERSLSYVIMLPTTAVMTASSSTGTDSIVLSDFTSTPSFSGVLDSRGKGLLLVGATRASLRNNQLAGSYSGSFIVTVVY